MDELWSQITQPAQLRSAWHLTRNELRSDFFHDFLHQQAFANALESQLSELKRLVEAGIYTPRPLRATPVPKGPLSTRPGSAISIRDRVVLWAVVKTIAPFVDETLSDAVYSYRLKENPKQGELFREGDALQLPFVRGKDISAQLDPFDPWYSAWPDFTERTKEVIGQGYDCLVVSDIAAYFENINLEILRDHIMSILGSEPKICNLIHETLRAWVTRAHTGGRPQRGIPQGSNVMSFLGNIYMSPIDDRFSEYTRSHDCIYIRYMDDVRIFCKNIAVARRAAFMLEDGARELHLNLQSVKTAVLVEQNHDKQITNFLFDDRIDKLSAIRDRLDKKEIEKEQAANDLYAIGRSEPINPKSSKLHLLKTAGNDLTNRSLRMWMNQCIRVKSDDYLRTLVRQIEVNPDQRISRIFVNSCRTFPRKNILGNSVTFFISSEQNIHSQQEAELIRGARYLSVIPDALWRRALTHSLKSKLSFQLRIQSLILLGMRSHSEPIYESIYQQAIGETAIIVCPYYISILGQSSGERRRSTLSLFIRHANSHCQEFGLLMSDLESNLDRSSSWMKYVFSNDTLICDWQGMLWFVAGTPNIGIRQQLRDLISRRLKHGGRGLLKMRLAAIRNQIDQQP